MDYERIYSDFIADRLTKQPAKSVYSEKHHIYPVSFGGTNEKSNLIRLTARDHYFAHCCLAKVYGGKMWSALFAIANMTKTNGSASYFLRGRMVAVARVKAANERSICMKLAWASGKFSRKRIYKPHSAEAKAKISAGNIGRVNSKASIDKQKKTVKDASQSISLIRLEDGATFDGKAIDFYQMYDVSQSMTSYLMAGKITQAKGWMLNGGDRKKVFGRDPVVRSFKNDSGQEFKGTTYDFRTKFSLDAGVISNLINGKNGVKSFKGWRVA